MAKTVSRRVRSESGAVFEVDAAMVDEPRSIEGPFRAPGGPLPTDAIKPAPHRRSWRWVLGVVLAILALALGASASVVASVVRQAPPSHDLVGIRD